MSCDYQLCMRFAHAWIELCQWGLRSVGQYQVNCSFCSRDSHAGLCSGGKQSKWRRFELWLIISELVLCVTGGDSTEYLWGVLYYVLLHVLNHYNIHIVWGFQLYAFPGLHTMLMCACDWCFIVFNSAKLMINVEEVMYYACIPQ